MHLIIPYAVSRSEACMAELAQLKLPNLQKLLARSSLKLVDNGDEFSLTPPHERTLAAVLDLPVADGQVTWAALQARQHEVLSTIGGAWGFITLCHWQVNTHHVAMSQLPMHALSQAESSQLLVAMRPYFEEDGITLHEDQAGRWLASGEVFVGLASASPDRVVGRNIEPWMPTAAQAAPLRRLQNEMQMLLYTHPVNDARLARGATPINSFWISGTGALPAGFQMPDANTQPTVIHTLREAALAENWPAWLDAWRQLDAAQVQSMLQAADQGQAFQLSLCGERNSMTWQFQVQPVWQKMKRFFDHQRLSDVLEKL